jgi:23S rRNA pseudouridine1911/1915/1917 synthase
MFKQIEVKSHNRIRLDDFLVDNLKLNKSKIHNLKVKVNDKIVKFGYLVRENDLIAYEIDTQSQFEIKKYDFKLDIKYEDDDLIVINKPKNMLVHPTSFNEQDTIINILIDKININDFDDKLRPGVIHRLDKNTSGLLLIAKNKKSYLSLIEQLKLRKLVRKYLAIVHNRFNDNFLIIKAPIDRSKQNLLKMVVSDSANAKPATTKIKIINNFDKLALIECELETGRTHQIRVHLAYIHHPVYNDDLYGSEDGYKNYHQFLHAHFLSFIHPTKNSYMEFESEPDKTFNDLLNKLRNK